MTLVTRSFEGFTPGTVMTAANSGANQVVPQGTGASVTYSDLYPHEGTGSAKFVASGNGLNIARYLAAATSMTASYGVGVTITATPTLNARFTAVRGSGPSVNVEWQTNNSIAVFDRVFANPITVASGLQPGTRYYLTIRLGVGTTTTNGSFLACVYNRAGTLMGSASSTTFDTGTAAITAADIGFVNTNSPSGSTVYIDYLQLNDGSTAEVAVPVDAPSYSATLALSGQGTQTRDGSPSVRAEVVSSGTGDLTLGSSVGGRSTLDLSGSGSLAYAAQPSLRDRLDLDALTTLNAAGSPSLASLVGLSGTATLTVQGRLSKALTARHHSVTTRSNTADIYYSSQTRTEVRVP